MELIKGELARKLIEICTDKEAKDILLYAIDSGNVELSIQTVNAYSVMPKKERKQRAKKAIKPDLPDGGPPPETKRVGKRKTLEQKCKEMEANYPEIYKKAMIIVGAGDVADVGSESNFRKE